MLSNNHPFKNVDWSCCVTRNQIDLEVKFGLIFQYSSSSYVVCIKELQKYYDENNTLYQQVRKEADVMAKKQEILRQEKVCII